jgi:hypothetical protein
MPEDKNVRPQRKRQSSKSSLGNMCCRSRTLAFAFALLASFLVIPLIVLIVLGRVIPVPEVEQVLVVVLQKLEEVGVPLLQLLQLRLVPEGQIRTILRSRKWGK